MKGTEAFQELLPLLGEEPVVHANGFICRESFSIKDREENFYMIGSMGLSSSIGLGVALKNPKKRIYVFDGDGNILMNLGSLTTIGTLKPKNLIHVIFDNGSHESTGGQPTAANQIDLSKIAKSLNYKVFQVKNKNQLENFYKKINLVIGPIMLLVKIEKSDIVSKRIDITPPQIKNRFIKSLQN
jgi:thiamine pyrophosphate-dependent acetolactate synthase large subunit-like protein